MSKNSRNTSKTQGKSKNLGKPFSKLTLKRSQKIAKTYHLVLEEHDRLGFTASCVELPTVFADGKSANECVRTIQKALTYAIATMIELGNTPPKPFSDEKRDAQVNIRLTYEEKVLLSGVSKNRGFRGLSDFVRTSVLDYIRNTT
jgi:predicted RNase H-like HicB family nuclease